MGLVTSPRGCGAGCVHEEWAIVDWEECLWWGGWLGTAVSSAISLSLLNPRDPLPRHAVLEHTPLSSKQECVLAVNEKCWKLGPRR